MNLLLDTCTFLWFAERPENLSARARDALSAPDNLLYLSPVSLWEILVKLMAGRKMSLHTSSASAQYFTELRQRMDVETLPITEATVAQLPKLPPLHQDPFDRLLICQSIEHSLTLMTPDAHIMQYPVRTLW